MKALRWRLTAWFALSLLLVVAGLVISAHWHLDYELRTEKWERSHPGQPDWVLHGSFTDKEIHDILGELLQFWLMIGVPLVGLSLLAAYFLARQSIKPVHNVNEQLARLGPANLGERIQAPDAEPEIAQLVNHLNGLLGRLETSFGQLQEYASHVAHELRTPLQLMRLRVETNAAKMEPGLAEDLQEELARLCNYVETALTIARAEQGRLELKPEVLPLKGFLADVVEPFSRLAAADRRRLLWSCPAEAATWTDRGALKQILFNVLNNALRHGREDIFFRVRTAGDAVCFLIGNRVAGRPTTDGNGLGIGLRLVRALVTQLPGAHLAFRDHAYFWVRLQIPSRKGASRTEGAGTGTGRTAALQSAGSDYKHGEAL